MKACTTFVNGKSPWVVPEPKEEVLTLEDAKARGMTLRSLTVFNYIKRNADVSECEIALHVRFRYPHDLATSLRKLFDSGKILRRKMSEANNGVFYTYRINPEYIEP